MKLPSTLMIHLLIALHGGTCDILFELCEDLDLTVVHTEPPMDRCDDTAHKTGLNLSHRHMPNFPTPREIMGDYQSITLENNQISWINTRSLLLYVDLECLNLAQNAFLPEIMISPLFHKKLKTLILNNQIPYHSPTGHLDSSLAHFPRLTTLDLRSNGIKTISDNFYQAFPNLTDLYLSDNPLNDLKSIFEVLPRTLKNLHLERTGITLMGLRDLNETNLSSLFLDDNDFPWFSFPIQGIRNLRNLSLKNCSIQEILSEDLEEPMILESLDLSYNSLGNMNFGSVHFPSLQYLSLSHNHLKCFPANLRFTNLTRLSLSYNEFELIPSRINQFTTLRVLSLRGNNISYVLARSFENLQFLEVLDLAENRLANLALGWTWAFRDLRYLNINSNQFSWLENIWIDRKLDLEHLFMLNHDLLIDKETLQFYFPLNTTVHY